MPTRDIKGITKTAIHRWTGKPKSPSVAEVEWSDRREGYIRITYHYIILPDSTWVACRPVEQSAVREVNPRESLSVLLVDGTKRTPIRFTRYLRETYGDDIEIYIPKATNL